jgi:methenyltetrahydrofolate cyclohydrolase
MSNISLNAWLETLAAKQPTPGGGAAAGLAAATAAALAGMVANYTTGPKWQEQEDRMSQIVADVEKLRLEALQIMHEDEAAFAEVGAAFALPKSNEDEKKARTTHMQIALQGAAGPPEKTALVASKVLDICEVLAGLGNPNVISDVAVAASFAKAALESAIVNIEINEHMITDESTKKALNTAVRSAEASMVRASKIIAIVRERIMQS